MSNQSKMSRIGYELPLLKTLIELGGTAKPDDNLYRQVGNKLGLTGNEDYDIVHARPKWVYELQWVRHTLAKRGELDGSQKGIWKITEKGRERVRTEWETFNSDDYAIDQKKIDVADTDENTDSESASEDIAELLAANFAPESLEILKGQLLVDDTPINQIITIINANKNLILTGPPGTGKTTLAINTSREAIRKNYISGYLLATATSDWTTFDTIGGYMPKVDKDLIFTPGIVLRAISENKWLLIDEINRADIDKAFGPLLTTLSGQDIELPFTNEAGIPIKIGHATGLSSSYDAETATYLVGDNWRIIGTMNTFDKNSLFSLSYAFMRRFGFVHINTPSRTQLHSIIDGRVQDKHLDTSDAERIKGLLTFAPREIGPAILIDILNYLKERQGSEGYFESLVAYILPQLEGQTVEIITAFFNNIADDIDVNNQQQMKRYLTEIFEIDPGSWASK